MVLATVCSFLVIKAIFSLVQFTGPVTSTSRKEQLLLAPQSGALIRDFHSHPIPITQPIHPLKTFEHLSLYIQKHLGIVTAYSKWDQEEFCFQRIQQWITMDNNG